MGGSVRYAARAELELVDVTDDVAPRKPIAPWDTDGWLPLLGTDDAELMSLALEQQQRQDALRGQTLESLLAALVAAIETDGWDSQAAHDATTILAWLLQENPELAFALDEVLRSGMLSETAQMLALAALGDEPTLESQQVLAGVATDPALSDSMRVSALHSVFQIAAPDSSLVQSIGDLLQSGAPTEVEGTALLLFGHIAGIDGDLGTLASVGGLLALEERALALGLTDVWLDAIGNAGADVAVPRVEYYLTNSQDASLRTTAVQALRDIQSPATTKILEYAALNDSSDSVRAAAANLLAARANDSAYAAASVRQVLEYETKDLVRHNVLSGLAAGSDGWSPSVKAALQWSAKYDSNLELRALAKGLLKGAGA